MQLRRRLPKQSDTSVAFGRMTSQSVRSQTGSRAGARRPMGYLRWSMKGFGDPYTAPLLQFASPPCSPRPCSPHKTPYRPASLAHCRNSNTSASWHLPTAAYPLLTGPRSSSDHRFSITHPQQLEVSMKEGNQKVSEDGGNVTSKTDFFTYMPRSSADRSSGQPAIIIFSRGSIPSELHGGISALTCTVPAVSRSSDTAHSLGPA